MDAASQIVPVKLPNGSLIHAEVTPVRGGAPTKGKEQDVAHRGATIPPQDIKDIMDALEGIAATVSTTVEKTAAFESSVEFGLEIGLESGKLTALLVKGTGKANLKVTLTWKK